MESVPIRLISGVIPIAGAILSAVARSQAAVSDAERASSEPESLATETRRQRIVMEFQAHSARVAQEVAIAERMATADEIEIEEYYEGTGKGAAGVQSDGTAVTVGLSGEGRRVTRRIIKIRGTAAPS